MNQTPSLSFMEAVKKCFANYANFKGRARRSEFWWWMLFTYIVNCVLYIPVQMLFAKKQALINEGMNVALQGGDLSAIEAQDTTTMLICFCVLPEDIGMTEAPMFVAPSCAPRPPVNRP